MCIISQHSIVDNKNWYKATNFVTMYQLYCLIFGNYYSILSILVEPIKILVSSLNEVTKRSLITVCFQEPSYLL